MKLRIEAQKAALPDIFRYFNHYRKSVNKDSGFQAMVDLYDRGVISDIATTNNYQYWTSGNHCVDSTGAPKSASTVNGVTGAKVCIDLEKLTELNASDNELLALLVHEHGRHYSYEQGDGRETYQLYYYVLNTPPEDSDALAWSQNDMSRAKLYRDACTAHLTDKNSENATKFVFPHDGFEGAAGFCDDRDVAGSLVIQFSYPNRKDLGVYPAELPRFRISDNSGYTIEVYADSDTFNQATHCDANLCTGEVEIVEPQSWQDWTPRGTDLQLEYSSFDSFHKENKTGWDGTAVKLRVFKGGSELPGSAVTFNLISYPTIETAPGFPNQSPIDLGVLSKFGLDFEMIH